RGSASFLARADFVGGTFAIVEDYTSMVAKYGGSSNNVGLEDFACNPLVAEQVYYILTESGVNIKTYLGAGIVFVNKLNAAVSGTSLRAGLS
ncbi:hypothetical protein, partial [Mesorhizobium sp. M1A.T.Ca.IN.004.03.1.1]|uniref:hypothetical protein n=1 Tax=Mesorhizobium sp. M1A.T.Ca.IN.004.03.1.1 TaxID=2496795 RepID=UPI0013E2CA9C